jgi:hypothetical protein
MLGLLRWVGLRRFVAFPILLTLLALALAAGSLARPGAAPAPKASKPLTIGYSGTFTMRNTAIPQRTAHSYLFRVTWSYWWTGTWGTLFRDPSIFSSSPTSFTKVKIDGTMTATYKERVDDADSKVCSLRIERDNNARPTLRGAYDTSAGTLQIMVEAPTFRSIKLTGGTDPNCIGGPGVNVFGPGAAQSPPSYFNPLGAGGTVRLVSGGTLRYDKNWGWKHEFDTATTPKDIRTYKVSIRSGVSVMYTPCQLIPPCAKAKR